MAVKQGVSARTAVEWVLYGAAALVLVWVAVIAVIGSRWPLVQDAPLMHYMVFLMERGFAPYRDITDVNMPGTYLTSWAVMHTLGSGAFAWYLWDLLTGLVAIGATVWIVGRKRLWAGLAGGGLAYVYQMSDGPWNLGQRDWMMAVLVLLGFGCLFTCIRSGKAVWAAGFVGCCGLACTIKPVAVVMLAVILPVLLWMQRGAGRTARTLGWAAVGMLPAALIMVLFLSHWGVWGDFLADLRGLVAYYSTLGRGGRLAMLRAWAPVSVRLTMAGAVLLYWRNRSGRDWGRDWESNLLALGAVTGFAIFLIQDKGWSYHSYTMVAFGLLWAMVEVDTALRAENGLVTKAVAVAVLAAAVTVVPVNLIRMGVHRVYPMNTVDQLESDLTSLGGPALSGHVQCLDMLRGGCINVLFRMQLVQSTGFLYDFFLFPEHGNAVTADLQQRFLAKVEETPPKVIVLSSHEWPSDQYGYEQLDRWPEFKNFLSRKYSLGPSCQPLGEVAGYQIYVLR